MKTFKVTYHLPDKTRIVVWVEYGKYPELGTMVELDGDDSGKLQQYKVTGICSWTTRFLFWIINHDDIYLDGAEMPLPVRKKKFWKL